MLVLAVWDGRVKKSLAMVYSSVVLVRGIRMMLV